MQNNCGNNKLKAGSTTSSCQEIHNSAGTYYYFKLRFLQLKSLPFIVIIELSQKINSTSYCQESCILSDNSFFLFFFLTKTSRLKFLIS